VLVVEGNVCCSFPEEVCTLVFSDLLLRQLFMKSLSASRKLFLIVFALNVFMILLTLFRRGIIVYGFL
jgi:hypothetical protein